MGMARRVVTVAVVDGRAGCRHMVVLATLTNLLNDYAPWAWSVDDDDNDDDSDDDLLDELAAMSLIRRRSLEFVLGVACMHYLHAYFVLWQIYLA